jgi:hypothetical protein
MGMAGTCSSRLFFFFFGWGHVYYFRGTLSWLDVCFDVFVLSFRRHARAPETLSFSLLDLVVFVSRRIGFFII